MVARDSQERVDSLKQLSFKKDSVKLFPFNPNFITDYKGYTLGMSVEEINKLHTFRASDQFVNSSEEFQKVTKISDSLLQAISPYFKFPEWIKKKPQNNSIISHSTKKYKVADLNTATAEDLKKISGIGEKLSDRIVKFRDRLGGFLVTEQLFDVYGLEADVADRTLKHFKLLSTPEIKKTNINTAPVNQLVKLVYIRYAVAQEIVRYREQNGSFSSLNELINIKDFPTEKIDRIVLYLSIKD